MIDIINNQLQRLNDHYNLDYFIDKVITKYKSKKYKDRWYNRGLIPPEDLLYFLFEYSKKYGRECNDDEWNKYGNIFSSDLLFCDGYYFNKMNGQGSIIKIIKQKL